MDLSLLKLILLTGAGQGVVLALLLTTRRANQPANRLFGVMLFLLSIHLVLVAFDERAFFMRFPHLSHITWLIPTLYGPLMLLFVRRLTYIAPSFRKSELLYFLPFLLWLAMLTPYYLQPADVKRAYLDDYAASVRDDFGLLNQLTNFVHLFFFALCIRVYSRHTHRLPHLYSDLRRVRLRWLRDLLYIALAIVVFGIFVFYARKYEWPVLRHFYPYHFLGVVLVIYWTGYRAVAQPALFTDIEEPVAGARHTDAATPVAPRLDPEAQEALAARLVALMEEEKLYLNSELTLQDLTVQLDSNRQYVSETLNACLGKNFYDFVNDYRVAEFKRLAADPASRRLTLLALGLEAGFNSKATFNAVFKKKTGLTPSQYLLEAKTGQQAK